MGALSLCDWYNQHSYFFYRVVYGDKDTFRFAWHRVGQPFAMPEHGMGNLAYTLLQYDPRGELIFQHRHADKWRIAGNPRVPGFQHECAVRRIPRRAAAAVGDAQGVTDGPWPAERQKPAYTGELYYADYATSWAARQVYGYLGMSGYGNVPAYYRSGLPYCPASYFFQNSAGGDS